MVYLNTAALPREEISAVLVQGQGINKQNIGQTILPPYGVSKLNGHLVNISIASGELLRIMSGNIVAPGGDVERITMSFGDQTYSLVIRKQEVSIPDEVELEYEDYFSTEAWGAQQAEDKLELTHEYLTSVALMSTATFGAAANSAVAYTAANLASISFIADIYTAIEACRDKGEEPNCIVIPGQVYQRLRQATLVVNFIRGYLAKQVEVNDNTIQQAFADEGIEHVLIGRSRYNSAPSGATPVLTKIWSNTYIWVGRISAQFSTEEGGMETISGVGATLYWEGFGLFDVMTYRDEPKASNITRAQTSMVPWIANPNAGTLIATQYS